MNPRVGKELAEAISKSLAILFDNSWRTVRHQKIGKGQTWYLPLKKGKRRTWGIIDQSAYLQ